MQALIVPPQEPHNVQFVRDHPEPQPAHGEVLIRVRLAGICSTDIEITRGYMQFTGILGHEFVGTVERGPDDLIGQRVVADINCPCGQCDLCGRGLGNHCPNRTVLGIADRNGAFADLLTIPVANCHIVPDTISDQQAVFVEPLAAAAHILDAHPIDRDTRVAVLGTGRLGLLVTQVLALEAGRLTVIGRNPRTLALCRRRGLETVSIDQLTPSPDYDVVVECTGSPGGLQLAMRLCRPCGTIVLKSTYAGSAGVNVSPITVDELHVVGNRCGNFPRALELLEKNRVDVDELASEIYPLEQGGAAIKAAARPESIKVLLEPGSS